MNYFEKMINIASKKLNIENKNIQVVWFSKILQNAKMIFIVISPDNNMYELTYNGDKKEFYLDKYSKCKNDLIKE